MPDQSSGPIGPVDGKKVPRFAGSGSFARLPEIDRVPDYDVAILGVPFDSGTSYRPGARFGPMAVRQASRHLRPGYHVELDSTPFSEIQAVDAGDVPITPFSIDEAALFHRRDGKEPGAQGAQDPLGISRMFGHGLEGAQVLAHRPLAEDLAREEEVVSLLGHQGPGEAKHQSVAVDAGVEVAAVAVTGVLEHLQVDRADVAHQERNVDPGGGAAGLVGAEKRGDEGNSGNLHTLAFQGQGGQGAVEPAGEQAEGFTHQSSPNLIRKTDETRRKKRPVQASGSSRATSSRT